MRALIRDRPGRNRENRCPKQELHPRDPISGSAARQVQTRFAQQLSAHDSRAVRKRTTAYSESFFQFSAQSFACRRMAFRQQEGKTVSVLIGSGVAKRSNVCVELTAVTRFSFVNETLRERDGS